MQRIYSHIDASIVHLVRHELEKRGIEAVVRGEHLVAVGLGQEAWTELWLVDERRLAEAGQVVHDVTQASAPEGGDPWTCPACGEEVDAGFAVCWSCGAARPEQHAA